MRPTRMRLRGGNDHLLALPWEKRLREWDATEVNLRDVPVGPSRHLVRFVETEGEVYALKELPERVAQKEWQNLHHLESRNLPAVRAVALVRYSSPSGEPNSILVTRYLTRSWQYRRLFLQLPPESAHRERLLRAMIELLVELHRNGVYWGDCSLANTLFVREGQILQAHLVDAETSEHHLQLTAGQREEDLSILVENVAGGMLDIAGRLELDDDATEELLSHALGMPRRYEELWGQLHEEKLVNTREPDSTTKRVAELNRLGYEVGELQLEEVGNDQLKMQTNIGVRNWHSEQLRRRTGLEVSEGKARILLPDLEAHQRDGLTARQWVLEVLTPGTERAQEALGEESEAVQAYCDLLEVKWLLSEQAGEDVGEERALEALRLRALPEGAAAQAALLEMYTEGDEG